MKTIEEILKIPVAERSPGEFLRAFKYEQEEAAEKSGGKGTKVKAKELYDIYVYISDLKGKPATGNMLVKAVRAEGSSLSNERSKVLAEQFKTRYEAGER
ncbi:MAG: hypothetical protein JHC33_08570 [Ignisphaera sp.]|nr:hypothetical protein [Ignisphaera sp.]